MKKRVAAVISIVMAAMVFISGCGANQTTADGGSEAGDTPEAYVELAKAKLLETKNFKGTFYGEVKMAGEESDSMTESQIELIREPLLVGINTISVYGSASQSSSTYLEETDEAVNMYMAYDNQWTEMTLKKENAVESVAMYDAQKNFELLLMAGEGWTEKEKKDGVITLEGTIPKEKVYHVAEEGNFLQLAGMTGIAENYYESVEAILIEVELKEDGTPLLYQADFTKTLETVTNRVLQEFAGEVDNSVVVEKYLVRQEISGLNEVKEIVIPNQAKDNAINYEKEISLLESAATENNEKN